MINSVLIHFLTDSTKHLRTYWKEGLFKSRFFFLFLFFFVCLYVWSICTYVQMFSHKLYKCMCMYACVWTHTWRHKANIESSSNILHFLNWGSVSQLSSEFANLCSPANKSTPEILCLCFLSSEITGRPTYSSGIQPADPNSGPHSSMPCCLSAGAAREQCTHSLRLYSIMAWKSQKQEYEAANHMKSLVKKQIDVTDAHFAFFF